MFFDSIEAQKILHLKHQRTQWSGNKSHSWKHKKFFIKTQRKALHKSNKRSNSLNLQKSNSKPIPIQTLYQSKQKCCKRVSKSDNLNRKVIKNRFSKGETKELWFSKGTTMEFRFSKGLIEIMLVLALDFYWNYAAMWFFHGKNHFKKCVA